MSEAITQKQPEQLETDLPGLVLIQMLTQEDDAAYFTLQNRNREYWSEFGNTIYDSVEAVTNSRIEKNDHRFGIYKDGLLVGMEGFVVSQDGKEAEVGICLDKDASGKGYATSAIKALSEFIEPGYDRVFAEAAPNNASSIQLLERTGYERLGGIVLRDWGPAVVFEYKK